MSQPATRLNSFDVTRVREDFPILHQTVHGHPLVYLDNGATSHKPRAVIDAVSHYYSADNSNVHRGVHALSERATVAYEGARGKVARLVNAGSSREVVFVRGTTEAINLVAASHVRPRITEGDEIVVSHMEHHSNIVPWQLLCKATGARLRVIPVTDAGELDMDAYADLLGPRTRFVSVVHVSNALGTINPVRRIVEMAHAVGAQVMLDGAQAAPHLTVDVQAIGCDFYAFSGHKIYGPTGIGVLWARPELLSGMEPYQGGGEMIRAVSFEETTYAEVPHKFEAGTPNIAGAIGLGAAIDYLDALGLEAVAAHEDDLLRYATEAVSQVPGLRIHGNARDKAGILSFVVDGIHAHDIGTILDRRGVAVRAGHHCAMPLMQRFSVAATARASFALYNTREEVDALVGALLHARELFDR
ncbi:MAG: cysteine desulfurase [Ectothiorhodospiraceae bacterium]|nr:cysteine desulfurase [Chromatiales bacterium]MCP5156850.1 cysteine desulfurase [Ectothiorhodospiraceae bacterium]